MSSGTRLTLVLIATAMVAFGCVASTAAAGDQSYVHRNAGGFALVAAKDGSFYYFGGTTSNRTPLTRGVFGGKFAQVDIPELKKPSARVGTTCVGGDGRVWASVYNKATRRTTIYRISGLKVRSKTTLPRGRKVTAMASDTHGRTWMLGRLDDRVSYFSKSMKLHSVKVKGSALLDSIVGDDRGSVWAGSDSAVKRIAASGVKRSVKVAKTATTDIEFADGFVWLTAIGGVQKVSPSGKVTLVRLQIPKVSPTGSDHAQFIFDDRMSVALFRRPDGSLGFTAGAPLTSEGSDVIADASVGRIDSNGTASETHPWPALFQPFTDFGFFTRSPGRDLATVDTAGNLWLAENTDMSGYAAGAW